NGYMTGYGELKYNDSEYKGEVVNGQMEGEGYLKAPSETYKGTFKNDLYHGHGKLKDEWDNEYIGEFKEGLFSGKGLYKSSDGTSYEGEFVEDEIVKGTAKNPYQGEYEGEFLNWRFYGQGKLVRKDKTEYVGFFEDGNFNGHGKLTHSNGDVYEGGFQYGQYHGKGVLTFKDPKEGVSVLKGEWRYGQHYKDENGVVILKEKSNVETALYNQNELLTKAFDVIEQQNPEAVDLYLLSIAGDGRQAVFRREVQFVEDLFAENFNTHEKSISLINSVDSVESYPLATKTSIEKSINYLASIMDTSQDILFVFLTSHGSKKFDFELGQTGMDFPDINAEHLANYIQNAGIKWKVVVVSACYSGGFIPFLQDENSLIITAAAAENTSFGCSDTADFTYFGEAYFKDALAQTNDFVEAFEIAKEIVSKREKEDKYEESMPQIYLGEKIVDYLNSWRSEIGVNSVEEK
ncbi:MAG: hypothetical protein OEY19_13750, partial [Gammaproteobacteria bacterium]|nr:hypothetical protein [Gammaproteobacteria bacterium]